jgi:hypothetical protein
MSVHIKRMNQKLGTFKIRLINYSLFVTNTFIFFRQIFVFKNNPIISILLSPNIVFKDNIFYEILSNLFLGQTFHI